MLNILKKSTPWMVASLFVATSVVFGQDANIAQNSSANKCAPKCEPKCPPKPCAKPCPQPTPPTQVCPGGDPCCPPWSTPVLNAAYNYPARTQTRCPWDINFDLSFIFWQPVQENMEIGMINYTDVNNLTGLPVTSVGGFGGNIVNQSFDFKPGFKIGMGGYFDYDGWDAHFEYTWFHNTQHESAAINPNSSPLQSIYATRGPIPSNPTDYVYTSVSENWNLKMDIAEFDVGRWYYVGTKLTARPSFGVRAAWIGQSTSTRYANETDVNTVSQKSSSWGLGAKAALDTNWMIGSGFRVYSNAEADLLFTKYTNLRMKATHTATDIDTWAVKQNKVYAVKPHVDLELGFGWGTYLDCNNYYWDLTLGYGFQVFFDQNMFRNFTSSIPAFSNSPNGNLYINGLTITSKLDF